MALFLLQLVLMFQPSGPGAPQPPILTPPTGGSGCSIVKHTIIC